MKTIHTCLLVHFSSLSSTVTVFFIRRNRISKFPKTYFTFRGIYFMVVYFDTNVNNAGFSIKIDYIVCTKSKNNFMALFDYFCYNNYYDYTDCIESDLSYIMIYGGTSWFLAAFHLFLRFYQYFWFYITYFPPRAGTCFSFWEV